MSAAAEAQALRMSVIAEKAGLTRPMIMVLSECWRTLNGVLWAACGWALVSSSFLRSTCDQRENVTIINRMVSGLTYNFF